MTELTKLTAPEILRVLEPYGITQMSSFTVLSGGSENTNYKIITPQQCYVLTICEQKSTAKCTDLVKLLDYLACSDFETSKAFKTLQGDEISTWMGKAVIVKSYIEGGIIENFSEVQLGNLGSKLAALHRLKAPEYLPHTLSYGIDKFSQVKDYAADSSFDQWLSSTSKYITAFIDTRLPRTLIHSDIFYNNTVTNPVTQEVIVMDFEEASHYYRIFDIGMTIIGTCCYNNQFNATKAKVLLTSYQQNTSLEPREIEALQAFTVYAAAATAFWRHQNYNDINPQDSMRDHYLTMQQLGQQILSIAPLEFIKTVGLTSSENISK